MRAARRVLRIPPSAVAVPTDAGPLDVGIPARSAFGLLAVHPFAAVVLRPDQGVEHEWGDDGQQTEHEGDAAGHPRKTSTMSLAPEVVSR